ncbi:MAG TPA: M20/M25/M40 family metallo-hydrolase [Vicinamibacterales bacterium]|nr:M20/M25/M40 family metallo-hydrolase [Vicinamibacterales bacterium]
MAKVQRGRVVCGVLGVLAVLILPPAVQAQGQSSIDPRILKLIDAISEERLQQLLQKLSSFKTRNTCSDAAAPDAIGAARQWIFDELKRTSPKLQVSFDTHQVENIRGCQGAIELRNVMAVLPGKSPRRIYVSGHYDSLNLGAAGQQSSNSGAGRGAGGAPGAGGAQPGARGAGATPGAQPPRPVRDPNIVAPGANDDGSGTVLSMELARVFAESGIEFDATLVFMTVAGEEQGLIGAGAHARKAKAEKTPIQAWFNNDIVGGSRGGDGITDGATIRLYSEGPEDSPSRALAMFAARIGAAYVPSHRVRLMARRDRFSRGGDHSALNAEGFAAIGFRESRENYSKQHGPNDTIDGVDFRYLAQNARVNAAGMAVLALAPPPPVVTTERGQPTIDRRSSGYDAHLRWQASPGAAGYRIFWRNAWAPDWQHELAVGNVTEYTFPHMNIDDWVFGVAAVDAAGHESSVSAYVTPPRSADGGASD